MHRMQKVQAIYGRSTASAAVFRLICRTNHAQIFEGVCAGELRAIMLKRGPV